MDEKQLITQLQKMRQIQPREEWASDVKAQLFASGPGFEEQALKASVRPGVLAFLMQYRFAAIGVAAVALLVTTGFAAQSAVPGDALYGVKRATEQARVAFVPQEERLDFELQLATERLAELERVVESNRVHQLANSIEQYQRSAGFAAADLKRAATSVDTQRATEVIEKAQQLAAREELVEQTLATEIASDSLNEAASPYYQLLVEETLADVATRTLTEEQEDMAERAYQLALDGQYEAAFELLLHLSISE